VRGDVQKAAVQPPASARCVILKYRLPARRRSPGQHHEVSTSHRQQVRRHRLPLQAALRQREPRLEVRLVHHEHNALITRPARVFPARSTPNHAAAAASSDAPDPVFEGSPAAHVNPTASSHPPDPPRNSAPPRGHPPIQPASVSPPTTNPILRVLVVRIPQRTSQLHYPHRQQTCLGQPCRISCPPRGTSTSPAALSLTTGAFPCPSMYPNGFRINGRPSAT